MIYFDVTKTAAAGHRSGLTRVNTRLRRELGAHAVEVTWDARQAWFSGMPPSGPQAGDWVLTTELFSEEERPGFTAFLDRRPCRLTAIFHDAIPLKFPHITWPQSVARHPAYLKLLARFDHVWSVSQSSRDDLIGFWRWQGVANPPPVEVLALGADFDGAPRILHRPPASAARLLCVGIVEPRKNQSFLLAVCTELWAEGLAFELHLVGRVNPHFGRPVVAQIKALQRRFPRRLHYHAAADDPTLSDLYTTARATLFPTQAEGCGLPLLESLWKGVPCVCSDLPVLRENADAGGCLPVPVNDPDAWKTALRRIATEDTLCLQLTAAAVSRPLPEWKHTAEAVRKYSIAQ